MFEGVLGMLGQLDTELRKNMTEYKGTDQFKPKSVKAIFTDKTLKLEKSSERANGDEVFVADKDWYVFDANYGTSEEKAFVRTLEGQIHWLNANCDEIYLARNERHFKIYNFDDGRAFEPDFVLFLHTSNGNLLTYQMFVEPKGKYLQPQDEWKKKFLHKVKERFADKTLEFKLRDSKQHYRLIGMPFYNNENENVFKQELHEVLAVYGWEAAE